MMILSPSTAAAAATLLACLTCNAMPTASAANTTNTNITTYTAELYLDLDDAGLESTLSGFVPALDQLFFMTSHPNHGTELWSFDSNNGNNAGMVKDINPGSDSGLFSNFGDVMTTAVAGGHLYFIADDGGGAGLWMTDGTEAGTMKVKDINIDSSIVVAFQDRVYFYVADEDGTPSLYVTDGTDEGTEPVDDGANSPLPPSTSVFYIAEYNDKTYFPANGAVCDSKNNCEAGKALFVLEEGVAARQVVTLASSLATDDDNKNMVVSNGFLYFQTVDGLYRTDGTQQGTILLPRDGSHYTAMEDALYFTCSTNSTLDDAICKTDGTVEGTSIAASFASSVGISKGLTPLGNGKILYHNLKQQTTKPHVFDTVSNKVSKVSKLSDIDTSDVYSNFVVYDNHAFFKGDLQARGDAVDTTGHELFVTDGTQDGTVLVKDINLGPVGSDIKGYGIYQNELYFNAYNSESGHDIWRVVKCPDGVCPESTPAFTTKPIIAPATAPPISTPTSDELDSTPESPPTPPSPTPQVNDPTNPTTTTPEPPTATNKLDSSANIIMSSVHFFVRFVALNAVAMILL